MWFDLSPFTHMPRLISRTLKRRMRRTELWSGNLESPLRTIFHDAGHIVRWGWSGRNEIRKRGIRAESNEPALGVIRLRTRREVESWLQVLSATEGGTSRDQAFPESRSTAGTAGLEIEGETSWR